MIYRILIVICFLGFSTKGATASLSLSKFIDKDRHFIHAFSEYYSLPNLQEDSIRTKDTLNGRNSSIKKLSLILAVSPWSMLYVPGCLEGNLSWKGKRAMYFSEFSWTRFSKAPFLNPYFYSWSLGFGIGINSKSGKSMFSLSSGIANRRIFDVPYFGGFYWNSYFLFGRIDFKIPVFFKRMILASGFTFSSFLFDPYFNSIYNNRDWTWEVSEAANYYYRMQKFILTPYISIGFRIF